MKIGYDIAFFDSFIKDSSKYFAHLPKESECIRQPELLSEHSALVCEYLELLMNELHLNGVLAKLINATISKYAESLDYETVLRILFFKAIAFHDLGKVNEEFQKSKMKNTFKFDKVPHEFGSNHAVIGMYIYLADFIANLEKYKITESALPFMCNVALCFAYSIYKHHSSHLKKVQDEDLWADQNIQLLTPYLSRFNIDLTAEQIEMLHGLLRQATNEIGGVFYLYNNSNNMEEFPLFALCKLNYSVLTASDYLATAHYMNSWNQKMLDCAILNNELKNRIVKNVKNYEYNKEIYTSLGENLIENIEDFEEPSNYNLNILRKLLAVEVITNIRKYREKNLFYIEAPTGGGKTNLSMLAVAELLNLDKDNAIDKIFYIFPFTTLVTQTYSALKKTFGLNDFEVAEIHSKAIYRDNGEENSDHLNYINNLMMNYPVSLMSHIRFFDILKTNGKEINYLVHRIANSVVVIDEIQSYSPQMWDKIVYFINNYAKYFNMKFIVMSATLPKIGNLVDVGDIKDEFVYLVEDKRKYFCNANFCNRVAFDYSLLSWGMPTKDIKQNYLLNLKNFLLDRSELYAIQNNGSVYTIIEFIFKKTASEFHNLFLNDNPFFDEIFLLSGTILEPRRREVISRLKSTELRSKKVLLVSTQVVEAGVDIDMDLGFKDKSILDSEEQLAGRINRNVNKKQCTLYIFDCDKPESIYGKDERYKVSLSEKEYKAILSEKNFDYLYDLVMKKIKSLNNSKFIYNIKDFKQHVLHCDFEKVDKELLLIKSSNESVFVPIGIPSYHFDQMRDILDEFNIHHDGIVSGEDVWNAYESVILNRECDFMSDKIKLKKLQAIMSNFIFPVFKGGKDIEYIKTYCSGADLRYGFYFMDNYQGIYSFENGINTGNLENSTFL